MLHRMTPNYQIIKRNIVIILSIIFIILLIKNASAKNYDIQQIQLEKEKLYNQVLYLENEFYELQQTNKLLKCELELQPNEEQIFYDIPLTHEQQLYIYKTCQDYDMDYKMFLGVLKLESNYNVNCDTPNYSNGKIVSRDRGISQINSLYEHWYAELAGLDKWDIFNFEDNIRMGIAGLAFYQNYWKSKGITDNIELQIRTLNSYNMGQPGFERFEKTTGKISRYYDQIVFNNIDSLN